MTADGCNEEEGEDVVVLVCRVVGLANLNGDTKSIIMAIGEGGRVMQEWSSPNCTGLLKKDRGVRDGGCQGCNVDTSGTQHLDVGINGGIIKLGVNPPAWIDGSISVLVKHEVAGGDEILGCTCLPCIP